MGIDPGSRYTGWGMIAGEGSQVRMLDCGVVVAGESRPLATRLATVHRELTELLQLHRPQAVFLESIFHHKSAKSALILGHARGVAMLVCAQHGIEVQEVNPSEVKKAVTGRGRADKAQVQEMVKVLLGLPQVAQSDASDALAVAFAGFTRVRFAASVAAPSLGAPAAKKDPRAEEVSRARAAWMAAAKGGRR